MSDYDLDQELIAAISTETQKQVGYITVPAPYPEMPYVIVSPYVEPTPEGDLGSQTRNRTLRYMVKIVAEDGRQVRWMSQKIRDLLTTTPYPVTCQWVEYETGYAIVPDGDSLVSTADIYKVRI
jgi:hypothetical protein